jgi:ribA/ribD-fused uncharacterized protein
MDCYDVHDSFVLTGRRITRNYYKREHPLDISHMDRSLIRSLRARAKKCVGGALLFSGLRSRNGYMSNFYPSDFVLEGVRYNSVEQRYQAMRARMTQQPDLEREIMWETADLYGDGQKRMLFLGRECLDRRPDMIPTWDKAATGIMLEAVTEKFLQNPTLGSLLLDTGMRPLGESTMHTVWGTALRPTHRDAYDTGCWGHNLLGLVLIFIRYQLS